MTIDLTRNEALREAVALEVFAESFGCTSTEARAFWNARNCAGIRARAEGRANTIIAGPLAAALATAERERDEARADFNRLTFTDERGAVWKPVPAWTYFTAIRERDGARKALANLNDDISPLRKAFDDAKSALAAHKARIEGLEVALKPFLSFRCSFDGFSCDPADLMIGYTWIGEINSATHVKIQDMLDAARAALADPQQQKNGGGDADR